MMDPAVLVRPVTTAVLPATGPHPRIASPVIVPQPFARSLGQPAPATQLTSTTLFTSAQLAVTNALPAQLQVIIA